MNLKIKMRCWRISIKNEKKNDMINKNQALEEDRVPEENINN
jgi:hypothetical protein